MPGEVEGFIGSEEVVLKNAATETTLQLLVQAVNASNPNKGNAGRLQKMYEDALKKSNDGHVAALKKLKEEEKERDNINKLLDKEQEKRKRFIEDLDGVSRVLGRGFTAIFATATPKLTDLTNALSGIPILGPIIGAFGQAAQDSIDNFRTLSSVGADLGNDINAVRFAAVDAGLSLDDFKNIVMGNATVLAGLEGNAAAGIKRFAALSGSIQKEVQPRLERLGFTMEETASGLVNYIELQTQLGRAQKMSDMELRMGSEDYLMELDQLARATGLQRKEVMELQKQQLADKNVKNVMLGMNEQQRKEYQRTLTALKAAGGNTEVFAKLVASGGRGLDNVSRSYARLYPEIARQAAAFSQNRGTFEGTAAAFNSGQRAASGMGNAFFRQTALLGVLGKETNQAATEMAGMKVMAESLTDAERAQLEAVENAEKAAAGVDRTFLNLRNIFMSYLEPALKTFLDSVGGFAGLMDSEKGAGKKLKEFMERVGNYFKGLFEILSSDNGGVGPMFKKLGSDIVDTLVPIMGEAILKLFTHPTVLTAMGLAFAAAIGVAAIKAVLVSKLTGALGGGAGAGAATAGRGVGRGAASLGTGLGQGLGGLAGGIMTGLAKGFEAFSNPKILVGATIFSGSIAIIGAGIAAASWLMGKALPTLAEGMKSLETLDGEKLKSVGVGMAAVGGGLLAFGTTSAVGGITNAFGSLVDGIAGLFGAKSPIEKLREFAVVGNDLGKAAEGFSAFKLAITDMPLNNLSFTDTQLTNLDIGTAKIRRLSSTLASVREEMKSISSPSITEAVSGAIKEIGTTITAKLGGEKVAKEKTVETLMTDLNGKVDRLNNNMANLVAIQERVAPSVEKTATYAKRNSGNLRPG